MPTGVKYGYVPIRESMSSGLAVVINISPDRRRINARCPEYNISARTAAPDAITFHEEIYEVISGLVQRLIQRINKDHGGDFEDFCISEIKRPYAQKSAPLAVAIIVRPSSALMAGRGTFYKTVSLLSPGNERAALDALDDGFAAYRGNTGGAEIANLCVTAIFEGTGKPRRVVMNKSLVPGAGTGRMSYQGTTRRVDVWTDDQGVVRCRLAVATASRAGTDIKKLLEKLHGTRDYRFMSSNDKIPGTLIFSLRDDSAAYDMCRALEASARAWGMTDVYRYVYVGNSVSSWVKREGKMLPSYPVE